MHQHDIDIPVSIGSQPATITGTLTVPDGARTLQVLVHGFTYDRRYWDFPGIPADGSYVQRATQAGYATLAIDRLGSGGSSRPTGRRLTWWTAADTVAQVIAAARAGQLGHRFDKLIYVGHSYGSVTGYRVTHRYPGVDALIATGADHRVNVIAMTRRLVLRCRPVRTGTSFATPAPTSAPTPDRLWVSTKPGSRRAAFNHTSPDPSLIARDEELKQPAGAFELPTALLYLLPGLNRRTTLPVLTVIGDRDQIFTGPWQRAGDPDASLADYERRFYAPGSTIEGAVIAGAGHCLGLEPQAAAACDRMLDFCDRHVGA